MNLGKLLEDEGQIGLQVVEGVGLKFGNQIKVSPYWLFNYILV